MHASGIDFSDEQYRRKETVIKVLSEQLAILDDLGLALAALKVAEALDILTVQPQPCRSK